jgi:hypothetical protein
LRSTNSSRARRESTSSFEAGPPLLGDVGDDSPQADTSVASVAPDASWQAPAQNRRRETARSNLTSQVSRAGRPIDEVGCRKSDDFENGGFSRTSPQRQNSQGLCP